MMHYRNQRLSLPSSSTSINQLPLDSQYLFVPNYASSWSRSKHFMSSLTPSHHVLRREKGIFGMGEKWKYVFHKGVTAAEFLCPDVLPAIKQR